MVRQPSDRRPRVAWLRQICLPEQAAITDADCPDDTPRVYTPPTEIAASVCNATRANAHPTIGERPWPDGIRRPWRKVDLRPVVYPMPRDPALDIHEQKCAVSREERHEIPNHYLRPELPKHTASRGIHANNPCAPTMHLRDSLVRISNDHAVVGFTVAAVGARVLSVLVCPKLLSSLHAYRKIVALLGVRKHFPAHKGRGAC
mmetsp:Transcript_3603/g.10478  ORF Transcript_3603/g.10478 Transcript_3603/m.10478 type:complete len:203 (-) Transcript_3603:298-906(-)